MADFFYCQLSGRSLTIANIYAPNTGQISFLENVLDKLDEFSQGDLLLEGDFNLALDPT